MTRRIVWDAAAWIALIIDEKIRDKSGAIAEDRGAMTRGVQAAARRGIVEIVSPALALVETCVNPTVRNDTSNEKIEAYFDHDFVQVAAVDRTLAKLAREIVKQRVDRSLPYCRPHDAVYVATAADWDIAELHTFDDGLLKLSEKFLTRDGTPIVICKPDIMTGGTGLFAAPDLSGRRIIDLESPEPRD